MEQQAESRRGTYSHFLTEYLALLVRWKRLVYWSAGLVLLVAVLEAIFLPKIYQSEARLLPVSNTGLSASSLRFETLSQFAGLADLSIFASSELEAVLSILDSEQLRRNVAAELNLVEHFGISEDDSLKAISIAAKRLSEMLSVSVNKWDNVVITATAPDESLAVAILRSTIRQLERAQNEMSFTTARSTRKFIEGRMKEAEQTLRQAQARLAEFQNTHGLIVLDEQQRSMVKVITELETQLTLKRAELDAALKFLSPSSQQVRKLRAEINAFEKQLRRLIEPDSTGASPGAVPHPPLSEIPDLAARYVRLAMDVEIQQRLLGLLAEQYEQAKISEVREVASFEILDPPKVPPDVRRGPVVILLIGIIVAVLSALVLPLLVDSLSRHFPEEARRDAVRLISALVPRFRRG